MNILYTLIIYPLVQIMEISFYIVDRIFSSRVLSVFGVSAVVSVCTMPLYFYAEKWQQLENDLQKSFKPKIDKIKSVFSKDEQYMILSAYYRQNHYHPVYALRTSIGVLIQIPFFIAAYNFLSQLEILRGVSFLFIKDLGEPDRIFSIGKFYINIMPIIMTLINCVSGAVYTRSMPARQKIQIFGMAGVFLILLYNSPSALVLYWTMNNVFSLLRIVISKMKHRVKIVYLLLCLCVILIDIRILTGGVSPKRLFTAGLCSLAFLVPLLIRFLRKIKLLGLPRRFNIGQKSNSMGAFLLSALTLLILAGLVIPGALVASSVQEFSYLDSYTTPMPFLFRSFLQCAGIFFLWPVCIYLIFSEKIKTMLSVVFTVLCLLAVVNVFLFPGDYGHITVTFKLANPDTLESNYSNLLFNIMACAAIIAMVIFFLVSKYGFFLRSIQIITLIALSAYGFYNIYKINADFNDYRQLINNAGGNIYAEKADPVFHLAKNGKNVIVIMMDAAVSGYLPYIFDEKPELESDFSGFTYFPNCASFGTHTRIGAPPIFGGYEYAPVNIQKDRTFTMKKHNEALLMMPRLFESAGYNVISADPSFANYSLKPDLSIFKPYPEIQAVNLTGNYTGLWLRSNPDIKVVSIPDLLDDLLPRFSLLRMAPPVIRVFIYDRGDWLKVKKNPAENQISLDTLDCYTTLDYLPQLTEITNDPVNNYFSMTNDLTHSSSFFQFPDYRPVMEVTDRGGGPFSDDIRYHVNMASLLLLGSWMKYLQENNVYDNCRIIIVSDHGRGAEYPDNFKISGSVNVSYTRALLLYKDFGDTGQFRFDNSFMTIADVPALAMNGIIDNPRNPFSDLPIASEKENGILVTLSSSLQYTIKDDQWYHVKDNILDPSNWERAEIPK